MAHRAALPSAKKIVKDNKSRLHIMTLWPVSLLAGRLLFGRLLVGNELPYLPLMGGGCHHDRQQGHGDKALSF